MSYMGQKSSLSTTSGSTSEKNESIEAAGDHENKGTEEQEQSLQVDSNYSDAQLLYLLYDKKAAARDPPAFVKEVHADVDLHPITILTDLGVDLTMQLGDCYHFFSWTRYPSDKAVFTRDRLTKDGRHCWSQGGGKISIKGRNEEVSSENFLFGCKRKFTFVEKPLNQKRSHVMVRLKSYVFRLEELVTAEDEEQEKSTTSEKRTPESFLSVCRLFPIMQSKISKKDLQRWGPYTYTEPDGHRSPLILHSHGQALRRASDPQSVPTLLCAFEIPSPGEAYPGRFMESEIMHNPQEWNSPELIYIPGHAERYDREWMGPFTRN